MAMRVLGMMGASGGIEGVRTLDFKVDAEPFEWRDECLGRGSYRGRPDVRGVLIVEDALTAVDLVVAVSSDVVFTVATGTGGGTGTITIIGFRADSYQVYVGDGTRGGPVTGYTVFFIGTLGSTITSGTAATHVQG